MAFNKRISKKIFYVRLFSALIKWFHIGSTCDNGNAAERKNGDEGSCQQRKKVDTYVYSYS